MGAALPNGDHRCDRGEGYSLHQWQPDPNPPEADRLDYGSDPARKKVSANELDQLLVREPDSRRQKQRYDHGTRVKRQHVLEPIDRQTLQWKNLSTGWVALVGLNAVTTLCSPAIF